MTSRLTRFVRGLFRCRVYTFDFTPLLNPTGAKCPCAKSISVFCSECEGNRK